MRLLEREQEGAAVQALAEHAAAVAGGLLVLEGRSGIGKSALLAELRRLAREVGVAVCSVPATRLGGEIPVRGRAAAARAASDCVAA